MKVVCTDKRKMQQSEFRNARRKEKMPDDTVCTDTKVVIVVRFLIPNGRGDLIVVVLIRKRVGVGYGYPGGASEERDRFKGIVLEETI